MKKKIRTKKIIAIASAIVFTIVSIYIFININPVSIKGTSEIYTKQDMNAAIKIIKDKVNSWLGCKLYFLSYSGDERSSKELDYCNSLNQDGEPFTECIVFDSCFCSPIWGGGGFEKNALYYWEWCLARTENGPWQLVAYGYA